MIRGFFFFKRKTAYEMRISYWSSDVCSSDLVAAFLAQLAADFLDDRVARIADGVHRIAESDHDLLALHPRADVGFGLVETPDQEETGRASCRERVCQYV